MSGGEPSSIKQKPSCAAELPIWSSTCGKAIGTALSNRPCAVLWSADYGVIRVEAGLRPPLLEFL